MNQKNERPNQPTQLGKKTWRKPTPRQARGMTFEPDGCTKQSEKKVIAEPTMSSSDDWSSKTSENTAPSPKRIEVKNTLPQVIIETTRKPTGARPYTLAQALGDPATINSIEAPKKVSISSSEKQQQPLQLCKKWKIKN